VISFIGPPYVSPLQSRRPPPSFLSDAFRLLQMFTRAFSSPIAGPFWFGSGGPLRQLVCVSSILDRIVKNYLLLVPSPVAHYYRPRSGPHVPSTARRCVSSTTPRSGEISPQLFTIPHHLVPSRFISSTSPYQPSRTPRFPFVTMNG